MLLLTSTSDIVRIVTGSAGSVTVHASYADKPSGDVAVGRLNTAISTATTTTVVASPAASTSRNVKSLFIRNTHASTSNAITVQHFDGTTSATLIGATLLAGESLIFVEGQGFRHMTTDGVVKTPTFAPSSGGNTGDQAITAATDTYIAGSGFQAAGRIQAGSTIRWIVSATKTAAGAATPVWTVRVGTAGTTSDTARLTFTGLAQTAAAGTGEFLITCVIRSVGASGVISGTYNLLGHRPTVAGAPVTGFATQAVDSVQATSAAHDNSSTSNLVIGLVVNTGASAVWTIKEVVWDAGYLLS